MPSDQPIRMSCLNIIIAVAMLFGGAGTIIQYKTQNRQVIEGLKFKHPFMQTSWYFVAQTVMHLFIYIRPKIMPDYLEKQAILEQKALKSGLRINPSKLWLSLTALWDWLAMCFYYIALLYIPASIIEMLRGGIVIFVAIFSVIFLGKRFTTQEAVGVTLVFIGMLGVGFAGIEAFDAEDKNPRFLWIGTFFLTCSMFFDGIFFVVVEKIYNVIHVDTMTMVAWTGTWGFVFNFIPLFIFSNIPCTDNFDQLCAGGTMENIGLWAHQMATRDVLFFTALGTLVSICTYAYTSLKLISETTALTRTLWKQLEPVLIWIISFSLGWEHFYVLQFLGFSLIIFGNLVYNKMVKLPSWMVPPREAKLDDFLLK